MYSVLVHTGVSEQTNLTIQIDMHRPLRSKQGVLELKYLTLIQTYLHRTRTPTRKPVYKDDEPYKRLNTYTCFYFSLCIRILLSIIFILTLSDLCFRYRHMLITPCQSIILGIFIRVKDRRNVPRFTSLFIINPTFSVILIKVFV